MNVQKVISGAIFSFGAYLTTMPESITVGATEDAPPIVEAIKSWAEEQGLNIDNVDHDWQDILDT